VAGAVVGAGRGVGTAWPVAVVTAGASEVLGVDVPGAPGALAGRTWYTSALPRKTPPTKSSSTAAATSALWMWLAKWPAALSVSGDGSGVCDAAPACGA
jgi:hypothetical protein